MSTSGQENAEHFTLEDLRPLKRDEIRQIASKLHISEIRSFNKNELIDAILHLQAQQQQQQPERQQPQLNEPQDSDTSDLIYQRRFSGRISKYAYMLKETQSLSDLIKLLYPNLTFLARKENSYKMSIGLKATFHSPKYSETVFYIQSKNYSKYEENKSDKLLNDLEMKIDDKDTEGSGWKVVSIDQVYLNLAKYAPLKGSSYVELPDFI